MQWKTGEWYLHQLYTGRFVKKGDQFSVAWSKPTEKMKKDE
jgi:hypothetical protein